jgi:glycosyltransferase involved in cell wall biosynthesis
MIRLLTIQPVAERGGSDQALARMLRSLPPAEFECHVVVPAEPPLRAEYESAGAAVHIVPMTRISRSHGANQWLTYACGWPLAVARLTRLIRTLDIDVVHTNSLHSWYGWAAAAITRTPHVWHAREIVVQSDRALTVERFLTRHFAARVVCMSSAIADQLPGADTVVIAETADPDEFSPAHAGQFRAAVGIPDDAPLVGGAGRIDTWKGFDVLLDAFPIVRESVPDAHLVIAGGAVAGKEWLADELAARAATLPHAHWLGPRTDIPDVLADLDCFVLPSTEPEPYGLVAVEALASGVPAVLTDGGGPREIAAAATPGAATLVPPGDPAALADAIRRTLGTNGPTSTESRRARPVLRTAEPERFAAVFRGVHQPALRRPSRPRPPKSRLARPRPSRSAVAPDE